LEAGFAWAFGNYRAQAFCILHLPLKLPAHSALAKPKAARCCFLWDKETIICLD